MEDLTTTDQSQLPVWMGIADVSEDIVGEMSKSLLEIVPAVREISREYLLEVFKVVEQEIVMRGVDEHKARLHAWVIVTKVMMELAAYSWAHEQRDNLNLRRGMRAIEEWMGEFSGHLFSGGLAENGPRELRKIRPLNPYY